MADCYLTEKKKNFIPIQPMMPDELPDWLDTQDARTQQWVKASGFVGLAGTICSIPESTGALQRVLLGVSDYEYSWDFGGLSKVLPPGAFQLNRDDFEDDEYYERALLAFGLGSYQFNAYRKRSPYLAKLFLPQAHRKRVTDWLTTIYLIRDLINTPAEDMGPSELAQAVKHVAKEFEAKVKIIESKDLETEFPAIYAVGRAGSRPPLLIDLKWGDIKAPKVTLVGKGVCFDSGGLDIKTPGGMLLMKKDMGGAAHALGLARMIMLQQLPVRLRLLIPAVENAIGSRSYRPGDVVQTRARKTIEITNTDAEGRVVLADALAEAVKEDPDLLIDFSTLTGAARIALGPNLPALFANQDSLAQALIDASLKTDDPLWRLPLFQPYRNYLKSEVADLTNSSQNRMAGAITAALFLQHFVSDQIPWAHFDIFAWNLEDLPGRPIGGEAMALRAVFHYLEQQYR
ncbi:leucyl aminopeptidase [Coxiella burnetii]|uniref:Cytosol aminopeptidase n=1 Tax=Coxiella burnetii (strain Dugway 5J108-111) TaxID=434922 RepID=A9KCN9_COXBN|nr:leucyl aminopeptidase family protein [Coxiella burnetii]ABS78515.1 cytosol aminopeptidase [Coxiella burnetii Dugway 5J108-111]OYK79796.1 leucyl aminopeptidase [Coxiella burnetii]OYK81878.1 leucyl aminopeptidase [Coxiella burnetii]